VLVAEAGLTSAFLMRLSAGKAMFRFSDDRGGSRWRGIIFSRNNDKQSFC
jgi:hypothetical protein